MAREHEHDQPQAAPKQTSRRSPVRGRAGSKQPALSLQEQQLQDDIYRYQVHEMYREARQRAAAKAAARAGAGNVPPEASAVPADLASLTPAASPEGATSHEHAAPLHEHAAPLHEHAAPLHEHAAPSASPHPRHAAPHASHGRGQEAAHETATAAVVHGVDPELLAVVLVGRGAPLDTRVQEAVAQHLGADLSAMRVYTGAEADLLSAQAGRMAVTVGEALIFGQGAYRPETPEGQRLLAEGLAAALEHGPGAHGPTPRAVSVTDGGGGGGGGGGHGEGVGAVRPLAAVSPFAGTGATGGHATAAQLLPLIRQVYAQPRQTGVQPHALVGNARAAEGHGLAPAHDTVEANYAVAALSLYAGVRGDRSGRPLNVHATPGGPAFTTLALCSVVYVDQKLTNKHLDAHPLDGRTRARYADDIWYRVALPGTAQGDGYVVGWGDPSAPSASSYLDFRTPDPASTLYHCTTPGEGALGIVARHYRLSDDVRRLRGDAYADLRFYVNVLSYLNPLSVPSPDPGGLDTANWEQTRVIREDYLWIPSRTFADKLKGKVGSGSYTHGGWGRFSADLRANWAAAGAEANEALDGLGALVALPVLGAGIVAGAATEVWDTLTGLLEAPAAVVGLIQELFSGQLFGLLQGLWDEITAKGGVAALVGTLFGPLEKEWNDADFFKRWFFRGTIIGGAVAFLALTFFSDGIVAALKGLSLTAKLADVIRGLDAAQGFVAAARAARETAAGRAVWQAFTLRSLTGSLGAGTLGALLRQRMALQDIKALADGIGPVAVKALVGQGVAGADMLAVAGKIGGATVKTLVAGKLPFADIKYLATNFDAAVVQGLSVAAARDLRAAAFLLGPKATTILLHGLAPRDIESSPPVLAATSSTS